MLICFPAMWATNDLKAALRCNAIVDCIADADHHTKWAVKAALAGQKIKQITNLMLQRPENLQPYTLFEEATADDQNNKIAYYLYTSLYYGVMNY